MNTSRLAIEYVALASLRPYPRNARTHSPEQVSQIIGSLREFGWTNPILVDEHAMIIAGHGRYAAAQQLHLDRVPVIRLEGLSEPRRRALALADNKIALNAGWDEMLLATELESIGDLQPFVGFSNDELLKLFGRRTPGKTDPEEIPQLPREQITQPGDVWLLDRHTIVCGDCGEPSTWHALPRDIGLVLTDPPYGLGVEYADAQREDSEAEITALARRWLPLARERAPVVAFTCGVTRQWIYPMPSWVLGWFYAGGPHSSAWGFSCWQPVLVYGTDPSLAGGHGRKPDAFDLNVSARHADSAHPCPKPVALWEKLIERLAFAPTVIADCFGGAGTTLIACEMLGHTAALIELSPRYCDLAVERWQEFTGRVATRERAAVAA